VGRNRLEPIGIIVCATLMGIASVQVIWESVAKLIEGTIGGKNTTDLMPVVDEALVILMTSAIVIKFFLFVVCNRLRVESDSMMVLAEDHRNDVLSNSMALSSAYVSYRFANLWWFDPVGGISISLYICINWLFVAQEQAALLEGAAAEPDFLEQVRHISNSFHDKMFVDVVRAYHFGKRYLVEVEVVLPGSMTVVDAHDISLDLQKKIERLENVERAFVHVDYQTRDEDEHKAAYMPTPTTSPSGLRAESDLESVTSSIDLEEEIQVLGDVFDKAKPSGGITTLKHHTHIRHHRSNHVSHQHNKHRRHEEQPLLPREESNGNAR
jgi:cation diffusion facilitator family transporter